MNFDKLHVITCISNPREYQARYNLYDVFSDDIEKKGATLWTVEMQTGARDHQITASNNPQHIQLWSSALPGELWHKENLLNIAIQHMTRHDPDWRYVVIADADIKFEAGAMEKIYHALQHWDVVQAWSHATDFDPEGGILGNKVHLSFMYCHWNGIDVKNNANYLMGGHPGFCWAFRRDAMNRLGYGNGGPLIDFAALGSGDRHMACGMIGRILESVHGDMHPAYKKWLLQWQANAERHIRRNVGYVSNSIRHMWHGRKADRGYASRWKILVKHQFNPETDLSKDVSGILRLVSDSPRQQRLRDDIRRYFIARKEDATTL